ncbi:GTP-binding protein [Neisseria sp. Ec49-e6-T10]|uniref:GTP-binding protein n=1 Tax=Neisseria sp. Ec49-e6-T10 TaxID=3140744 RepID=UPI003EB6FAAA
MVTNKYKILFAGDVGTGKTTAIRTISDIDTVDTDVNASDAHIIGKKNTTVAFDYGEVTLPYLQQKLRLYGIPGQPRFSFMWEMLAEGIIGTVLLADNSKPDSIKNARTFIKSYLPILNQTKTSIILGITKIDLAVEYEIEKYQNMLLECNVCAQVHTIDARNKEDILFLINSLLKQELKSYLLKTNNIATTCN